MKRSVAAIAAVVIIGASAAAMLALFSAREQPTRKQVERRAVAVETVEVRQALHRLDVRASGVVVPARDLTVHPEVSGRVAKLYAGLTPGSFIKQGETLFRIDASDYGVAVKRGRAALLRARSDLELERGRSDLAQREVELLERVDAGVGKSPLALRKPQLRAAQSNVAAAKADLQQAKLNLARTSFRAPFDAVIVEAQAEIGQLATPATPIARLVGTDAFWVRVSVPADQLPHIAIPGLQGESGAAVAIEQSLGEDTLERRGKVLRLLSNRDPSSRMTRLLVEIVDPYGFSEKESKKRPYPILLDTYVDVIIRGKEERRLIQVPRRAVLEGGRVHVFDRATEQLQIRRLEVAWALPDSVLVAKGLRDGELVVTTPLTTPVEGMKLRDVTAPAPESAQAPPDAGAAPDG